MKNIFSHRPEGTKVEVTSDMVKTVGTYFDRFEVDGVATLEINQLGLWFIEPITKNRIFIGFAEEPGKARRLLS